jgi:hypothetical protein
MNINIGIPAAEVGRFKEAKESLLKIFIDYLRS